MAPVARTDAQLNGELSFATVPRWLDQADTLLAAGPLDLSRVTRTDSAGLALLLELSQRAKAQGKAKGGVLALQGAPVQVIELARFFGLDAILAFEQKQGTTGDVS